MGEMLKELGKFLYNLSLLIIGALILQPLTKGKLQANLLILAVISVISFITIGSFLIFKGEQFKNKKED